MRVGSCEARSGRTPDTLLPASSHSEWSPQRIPIPTAPSTSFRSAIPIDISVSVMPRRLVPLTRFRLTIAFA